MSDDLKTKFPHRYHHPKIHGSVLIAPGAHVRGDVEIGEDSSVWFNSVIRGDVNFIRIGKRTNIQDLSMVHVSYKKSPCVVGDDVTVGHSVILHACTIGSSTLVGMGSCVLDDAELGDFVLLGAGSLVTVGQKIPSGMKAFGRPAKVVGPISDEERKFLGWSAQHYVNLAKTYK